MFNRIGDGGPALDFAVIDRTVARGALDLMSDPGLSPRDAFHAAHAIDSGCPAIVSANPDYDLLAAVWRFEPA